MGVRHRLDTNTKHARTHLPAHPPTHPRTHPPMQVLRARAGAGGVSRLPGPPPAPPHSIQARAGGGGRGDRGGGSSSGGGGIRRVFACAWGVGGGAEADARPCPRRLFPHLPPFHTHARTRPTHTPLAEGAGDGVTNRLRGARSRVEGMFAATNWLPPLGATGVWGGGRWGGQRVASLQGVVLLRMHACPPTRIATLHHHAHTPMHAQRRSGAWQRSHTTL